MSFVPTAYDDHDSMGKMHSDCTACSAQAAFSRPVVDVESARLGAPSIAYEDFAQQSLKPEISISEAAQHLANRVHLHLD
ncbi:MAG TPA: hypothetical protein PKM12_03785 [Marmoricola sp.]|nr:hypothetical protein [Marmoricola sp.]HNI70548.1 hypothetical protein [Marmoricola sp.]HNN48065.1 hypothetical protein [Marmoricola sp.]HNO40504.1 hypothetical protein [Marmoricola sp.]